jgi:hypothetical protein
VEVDEHRITGGSMTQQLDAVRLDSKRFVQRIGAWKEVALANEGMIEEVHRFRITEYRVSFSMGWPTLFFSRAGLTTAITVGIGVTSSIFKLGHLARSLIEV